MRILSAVTLSAPLFLAACAHHGEPRPQNMVNEQSVATGTGNTGAGGTAAPGPNINSQSRREAAREAELR